MTCFEPISSHRERLDSIVKTAYEIVCKKIASDAITIFNEASLQLHLGNILSNLGQLYEFSRNERFVIELEKNMEGVLTSKSNGSARCDITAAFIEGDNILAQAFIELKYFKASKDANSAEATKDNRFALFMDLENLEQYRAISHPIEGEPLCYEIAVAQSDTYANPDSRSVLKTGNGCWTEESRMQGTDKTDALVQYAARKPIDLKGNYQFEWKSYAQDKHCLLVKMQ